MLFFVKLWLFAGTRAHHKGLRACSHEANYLEGWVHLGVGMKLSLRKTDPELSRVMALGNRATHAHKVVPGP